MCYPLRRRECYSEGRVGGNFCLEVEARDTGVETWVQRVEPPSIEGYSQALNPHRVCPAGFQNFRESVPPLLFPFSLFWSRNVVLFSMAGPSL